MQLTDRRSAISVSEISADVEYRFYKLKYLGT